MIAIITLGRANTGLVIGDMTFDFNRTVSGGAAVTTANVTMSELGAGAYRLINPDITEDTAFSVHKTSAAAIYAQGVWSPADGDIARQTTSLAIKAKSDAITIPPTEAAIAAAVWASVSRTLTGFGFTTGLATEGNVDSIADLIHALNNLSASQVWGYGNRALTDKSGFSPDETTAFALVDIAIDAHNTRTSVDALSTAVNGLSSTAVNVIIPTIPGRAMNASLIQDELLVIKRGDTPSIPVDLGADYPGFDIQFAGRKRQDKNSYVIGPRQWRRVDDRHGYLDLTSEDTATLGMIDMEVEAKLGDAVHTTNVFMVRIVDDVLKERAQ